MRKTTIPIATPELASTGNVLVPSGLLRSISNKIYDYNPRGVAPYKRAATPVGRLVYGRSASIASTRPRQRAVTPDYGVNGAQIGLAHPASDPVYLRQSSLQPQNSLQTPLQGHGRGRRFGSDRTTKPTRDTRTSDVNHVRPSLPLFHSDNTIPEDLTFEKSGSITPAGPAVHFRTSHDDHLPFSPKSLNRGQTPTSDRTISPTQPAPIITRDGRFSIVRHSEDSVPAGTQGIKDDATPRKQSVLRRTSIAIGQRLASILPDSSRRSSIRDAYEKALERQKQLQRSKLFQVIFQYLVYTLLLVFIYLILVGRPIWGGTVWYIYVLFDHYLGFVGGSAIFIGLAAL